MSQANEALRKAVRYLNILTPLAILLCVFVMFLAYRHNDTTVIIISGVLGLTMLLLRILQKMLGGEMSEEAPLLPADAENAAQYADLVKRLKLKFEQDTGTWLVSEKWSTIYGEGITPELAVADYLVSFGEWVRIVHG